MFQVFQSTHSLMSIRLAVLLIALSHPCFHMLCQPEQLFAHIPLWQPYIVSSASVLPVMAFLLPQPRLALLIFLTFQSNSSIILSQSLSCCVQDWTVLDSKFTRESLRSYVYNIGDTQCVFLTAWLSNEWRNKKSCIYPLSMEVKILEIRV